MVRRVVTALGNGWKRQLRTALTASRSNTRAGLERLSVFTCQQHRRDLIEFPEWMDHPNGATGFASATILAERRDQPAVRGWLETIHGAGEDPSFFATGISLVAHMANPHVPAVHMNTRFLTTTKAWFGGGADLNPPIPYAEDTAEFHAAMQAACDPHNETYYERYSKWAEEYFYIPHRKVGRGVGGIFCDHLECPDDAAWQGNFAFIQDIGKQFLEAFPAIVRKRMNTLFDAADEAQMFEYRGRYAEFNLVYDRGTIFGLKTGGNIDAILMSLPPRATWS